MAVCFLFCFLLLFVCRSSVTAEEEQMFDGNQTLETMARMETKMAKLEENVSSILEHYREEMDELRTQNGNIERKGALLKEIVLSILKDRREEMDEVFHTQREEMEEEFRKQNGTLETLIADVRDVVTNTTAVMENVAESIKDTPKVAFNAYATVERSYSYSYNEVVIFRNVLLNEGGGYNNITGKFTAPISGLYIFHAHVCNQGGLYIVVSIVQERKVLTTSTTYESKKSICGSVSAPALVNEGENVFIMSSLSGSKLYANEHRWPSFSGFLVNE